MDAARSAPPKTSGNAIAALVLGIASIVVFPLIGVLALVFGYRAREELRTDPDLGGDGLATAGIVLGWIGVAIAVVALVFILLVVGVAF